MRVKIRNLLSFFNWSKIAFILLLSAVLGCSSSSDPLTGTFIDSPVSGLNYSTISRTGVTDANGNFVYYPNEIVSFSIGAVSLGQGLGASVMTPLSITAGATSASDQIVNNKLILLQTLDADGNLNNGIQITDAIRAIVTANAASINFNQTTTAFRTSLAPLLTALNAAKVFSASSDPRDRTAVTAAAALEHFTRSSSERKIVNTQYGQVAGYASTATTWQWLGIPYAKPPLGDLRWKPPQAPSSWTGVRQAVGWSDQAPQNPIYQSINEGGMSEDCLHLHITAPKNASNLPVMVWFHGGSFTILSNSSKQYNNPQGLPTKGVVLVTVNHRLGPFGYMAHPLLTAESGYNGSGNYGQMDLVLALTWVKNNIANFGGDPNNVTIFGQSGGGGKVIALMMSPQARGLFHKAICQSGASPFATTGTAASSLAGSEAIGTAMFNRLKITTLAQARALPWTAIVQSDIDAGIPREIYRPNVDYYYLPKTYYQTLLDGTPSDVPFMVGVTSGDYTSLRTVLGAFMTQRATYYKSNQYVYDFRRVPEGWAAMGLLSAHGGELPYLFNYPMGHVSNYNLGLVLTPAGAKPPIGDLNGNGITGTAGDVDDIYTSMAYSAADTTFADTTMNIWTNFAKNGNPNISGLAWPVYTIANDAYVEIGHTAITVKTGASTVFK